MSGFTWMASEYLILLLAVPVGAGLHWLIRQRQRRARAAFSDARLFREMNPKLAAPVIPALISVAIQTAAWLLLILALARPAGNPEPIEEEINNQGIDIMLVMDLSASMKATDLVPTRIQAAKNALKTFVDQLTVDQVGLTVFAGSVAMQSTLTHDYATVKMMLDIVNTDFLPRDGTAIGDALEFALGKIGKERQAGSAIVLLTDGENTSGKPPMEAALKAQKAKVRIFAVGIGTPGGAKIPIGHGTDGTPRYLMYHGQPVVTKLDEGLLADIARMTGGRYYLAESSQSLMDVYGEISQLTKTTHKEKKQQMKYREYFQWLALPGLLLLILDLVLAYGFNIRKLWKGISSKPMAGHV